MNDNRKVERINELERQAAAELSRVARSLFQRGYSFGTAGNVSARVGARFLVSATGSSFETLDEDGLALLDSHGTRLNGMPPSEEAHFHLALYRARPDAGAIVHLHSTYATALSCLRGLDHNDALPVYTPYFAMKAPCLPVVPYFRPGDPELAVEVERVAPLSPALLLKNHGPVTAGVDVQSAAALAEELEEQCRLFFLLGARGEQLTAPQLSALRGGSR